MYEYNYNRYMAKSNSIHVSLPNYAYDRTLDLAEHINCVSDTGNPKAASTIKKVFSTILKFYGDEEFQRCLEVEDVDALAYVQKCIKRGMKESLKEGGK